MWRRRVEVATRLPWLLDFRGRLEPELLKADLDGLSHPALS
jgi:hypothetical protein